MARISLILAVLLVAGCSSVTERFCTEIGCDDGINVSLSESRSNVTLQIVEPDGTIHEQVCEAEVCDRFFFAGIRSQTVTIRLVTPEETIERDVEPQYVRTQPNGRGCPPVCHQAQITLTL